MSVTPSRLTLSLIHILHGETRRHAVRRAILFRFETGLPHGRRSVG